MDLSRVAMVIGLEKLEHLKRAHVIVVGLGGVGSYVAEALVRSGVGNLTIVDADTISSSNINRQLPALFSTFGRAKTEIVKERLLDINPKCKITVINDFYKPGDFNTWFTGHYDYLADAIDSTTSKVDLITQAVRNNIPTISAMGTGNKLMPERLRIADISKTFNCPLAKAVRKKLREAGIGHGVDVVFSDETPLKNIIGDVPGSMVFVPATAGILMASYIVRVLTEQEIK